ncbi:Trimeric GatFAB AmidoTransferase(AdT) complex subunit [Exophiala sideris]|nr:Trimeric GatFAB AmidoTransferase(AdT) complex subunit [Exophiala sideris]
MRVLAKTNMDEFGMGSHSINSAYGPVTNGRGFKALSVGGSSGGSALAVAAKLAHIGIGTDTGGSIRLPAAYMSVLGFKPSYDILRKPDENDPTCLTSSSFARVQEAKNRRRVAVLGSKYVVVATDEIQDSDASQNLPSDWPWRKLRSQLVAQRKFTRRVGVPLEYNIAEMHPLVRWAWTATLSYLETIGCEIVPISLPSTRHALSSYYVLAPAEASSNLAKYDGVRYGAVRESPSDDVGGTLYSKHRSDNFGPEVKRRILLGTYSLSAGAMDNYFIQAQKIRRMVQQDFDDVFRMPNPFKQDAEVNMNGVDFIIAPTAPSPPPRLRYLQRSTPVENYMNDVFTVPASLAGLPSMSVPAPRHPDHAWRPEVAVGMQIIGQYGDDYSVMYLAQNYMTNFHPTAGMKRVQTHKILT